MNRVFTPALTMGLAAVFLCIGCTRTIYVIQEPDGTLKKVDPPPHLVVEPDHQHDRVIEDDGVLIELLTSTEYVLSDGSHPVHLQITVEGRDVEFAERAPLNLAIVVDRSGSMRGRKLEHARQAARHLISRLSDGDRVSVISYASDVRVDVHNTRLDSHTRRRVLHAVDRLSAGGQTHLSGGLQAGAAEIRLAANDEQVNRIVLLSDGRANVGIQNVHQLDRIAGRLYEEGITVTTMGVGLDYNEDLMCALAVAGGGNYYFIERPSELARMFEAELDTLANLVVRDTILYLELPDGVSIEDLYGYRYEQRGREVKVNLSSVAVGQKRRVLVALDVPPGPVGRQVVARGRIEYRNEVKHTARTVALQPIAVSYTRDRAQVARSINRPVMEKLELVRNARARREAMARLDAGDRAGASRIVKTRLQQGRTAHRKVGGKVLEDQVRSLQGLGAEVDSAPPAATPAYKRMRKTRMREAYDFDQY